MTMSSYTWQPRFETDYALGHASDGKVYPKDKDNAARAPNTLETTTEDYAKKLGVLLMSNSDNAESIFGYLLTLTIADTFAPLEWEQYLPFDRSQLGVR